jgi:hypothetical protein
MTALLLVLLTSVAVPVPSPSPAPSSQETAFYAAIARAQQGQAAEAVAELDALVARAPDDLFADDAMFEAARLTEERLGDPLGAALRFETLCARHPDSRLTVRAERRAKALRAQLGPGGRDARALADWQAILASFPERGRAGAVADAEALLAREPAFNQAGEIRLWIAQQRVQLGQGRQARALLVTLAGTTDELGLRARRALADLDVDLARYADARAGYQALYQHAATPTARTSLDEAMARLERAQAKDTGAVLAWCLLGLMLAVALGFLARRAGGARALLRLLARPPLEALYVAPVAALFVIAGLTENELYGMATVWLAVAMIAVAYLVGTALRAPGPARSAVATLAWGVGGMLAMLLAGYVIVFHLELLDTLVHTVQYGVER